MKDYYSLQITFNPSHETYIAISQILDLEPTEKTSVTEHEITDIPRVWRHEMEMTEFDPYFDFINYYSDIISDKFEALVKLGIERDAISVWLLKAYNGQCNLEFDPARLKKLAYNGITLCISCWEEDE